MARQPIFFMGLSRFSVDLDFDLLDAQKEDTVFEKINDIVQEYGSVVEARKKRYSIFFY